jgi:ApbE superfamily uncharacterized protein (UPF0280 family)
MQGVRAETRLLDENDGEEHTIPPSPIACPSSLFTLHSSPARSHSSHSHSGALGRQLDAQRWHFQHGPIDLIIGADGPRQAIEAAMFNAWTRFETILTELVAELPLLRSAVQQAGALSGPVARRMLEACQPHADEFITPMAAVAGAVADELIEAFRSDPRIQRAYVNNGGDIALHLAPGYRYGIGVFADLSRIKRRKSLGLDGELELPAESPVRGVATSGWRGRSFSLGIADSVTVLADCAAAADAAATMVANCVNVDDPAILRQPACDLKDDSDLGERLVTVDVGPLPRKQVEAALSAGVRRAELLIARGLIHCAALWLRGQARVVGDRGIRGTTTG